MTEPGCPTPILRIFDEVAARAFYVEFLEFGVEFEHRFEAGLPLYLSVVRGDCRIHLSEHHGDSTPGAHLRILIGDAIAFSRSLRAKRYKFARPGAPAATPWGTLELTIGDPFGNWLTFFETKPPRGRAGYMKL